MEGSGSVQMITDPDPGGPETYSLRIWNPGTHKHTVYRTVFICVSMFFRGSTFTLNHGSLTDSCVRNVRKDMRKTWSRDRKFKNLE